MSSASFRIFAISLEVRFPRSMETTVSLGGAHKEAEEETTPKNKDMDDNTSEILASMAPPC